MIDRGWTDAQDLAAGDQLIGHDGRTAVVDSVTHTGRHETVYSLRVERYNTYFVSNEDWHFSVWVHNACFKKKQNDAGKWEITDADNNPINEVFDTEAAANKRLAELNTPDDATGRIRDPRTGKFLSDPDNPRSQHTFTDSQRRSEWRRLAEDPNSPLTPAQRAEIKARGWRGPQRVNEYGELEAMELSHEPIPLREGGTAVVPRWLEDHAAIDPHRHLKKRDCI